VHADQMMVCGPSELQSNLEGILGQNKFVDRHGLRQPLRVVPEFDRCDFHELMHFLKCAQPVVNDTSRGALIFSSFNAKLSTVVPSIVLHESSIR
jgi:hypothetical protein